MNLARTTTLNTLAQKRECDDMGQNEKNNDIEVTFIDGSINAQNLASNMKPSLQKLGTRGILQYDNNTKQAAKIRPEFKKKLNTMLL